MRVPHCTKPLYAARGRVGADPPRMAHVGPDQRETTLNGVDMADPEAVFEFLKQSTLQDGALWHGMK